MLKISLNRGPGTRIRPWAGPRAGLWTGPRAGPWARPMSKASGPCPSGPWKFNMIFFLVYSHRSSKIDVAACLGVYILDDTFIM